MKEDTEAKGFQKADTKQSRPCEQSETMKELTKQVARGGGIAFIGSVIGRIAAFGLHILLGRVLGPRAYGLYTLGASVTEIAQSMSLLGLTQGVVRFCAMYRGKGDNAKVKGVILSALKISLVSSFLIAAVLLAFSEAIAQRFFNEVELTWVLRVFALSIPCYVLIGITTSFAQAFRRIEYQQGVQNVFRPLTNLALVGFAFLLGFHLAGAVFGFLFSGILSAGVGLYSLRRIFPEIKSTSYPTFDQTYELIKFSLPMMFVSMSYFFALKTDRIMLGMLRDARDVGIYNASANISLQLGLINSALVEIFKPVISDIYNKGQYDEMKKLYDLVKRWSSYGTFFLTLPIILFSKIIMSVYGSQFTDGWRLLIILPAVHIVGAFIGPNGALLQMTGRQNVELLCGFLMIICNILLNYLLIPIYGYLGAAMATSLSVFLMTIVQLGWVYRFFRLHPFDRKHMKLVGLASAIFATSIVANMFMSSNFKLPLFLLAVGLFLAFSYNNRTEQDKFVWKAINHKLIRRRLK